MAAKSARTGFTNPFGKLDPEPINGLKVPTEVKGELVRMANEAGLPFHEFLREALTVVAMGKRRVKDAYAQRAESIVGLLKE